MPGESKETVSEARRLEGLWAGEFGDAYTDRNRDAGENREAFWQFLLSSHPIETVLEVGCNVGANLRWIRHQLQARNVCGVDVNEGALQTLRQRMPDISALWAPARELPFRDRYFDLAFTSGVLIHQPEATLPLVMAEVVRVSRRYVLALEYHADETTEVTYRGEPRALFKRDYRRRYLDLFPEIRIVEEGFLSHADGWDDVTWALFERSRPGAISS